VSIFTFLQVVAANNNGICFVWSMLRSGVGKQGTSFEPLHRLKAHDNYILKCLISPDVRKLATTSSDKTIKIWSLYNYSIEKELVGHSKWVWDAVFSVDAAYLVTASSDHSARLWDVEKGQDIKMYSGHTKAVVCCALNDNALDGAGH
jgi:target of rapamycin complex subunit LST8